MSNKTGLKTQPTTILFPSSVYFNLIQGSRLVCQRYFSRNRTIERGTTLHMQYVHLYVGNQRLVRGRASFKQYSLCLHFGIPGRSWNEDNRHVSGPCWAHNKKCQVQTDPAFFNIKFVAALKANYKCVCFLSFNCGLCSSNSCDRNSEWRTGNIVHANFGAEFY